MRSPKLAMNRFKNFKSFGNLAFLPTLKEKQLLSMLCPDALVVFKDISKVRCKNYTILIAETVIHVSWRRVSG